MLVSGVLNGQKTRTFTQYPSNAVVQNFNDFLNKRERERERERENKRARERKRMNESNHDFCAKQNEQ